VQGFTESKADRDRRKQRAKNERQRAARKAEVEKQREEEQLLAVAAQVRSYLVVVSSQVCWERKGWNGICQGVCNARRAEKGMQTHLLIFRMGYSQISPVPTARLEASVWPLLCAAVFRQALRGAASGFVLRLAFQRLAQAAVRPRWLRTAADPPPGLDQVAVATNEHKLTRAYGIDQAPGCKNHTAAGAVET